MKSTHAIVYAANNGYAFLAGISMLSVFDNNENDDNLCCFILSDGIDKENQDKLLNIARKYNRELEIIEVRDKLSKIADTGINGYDNAIDTGYTAYARILIDQLLPNNISRILYLDCDTLVCGQLSELFDAELAKKPIGMCYDLLRNEYKKVIGIDEKKPYYNSGVMLIDRNGWKKHGCERLMLDKLVEMGKKHIKYPLVDQDVINVTLAGYIKSMSVKYNYLSSLFLYNYTDHLKVFSLSENYWYGKNFYECESQKPVIYHFAGTAFGRPWFKNSNHPIKALYDKYYKMSPWREREQERFEWEKPRLIQYWLYKYTPYKFSVMIGKIMQMVFIKMTYGV